MEEEMGRDNDVSSDFNFIRLIKTERFYEIRLASPSRRNALSMAMVEELQQAVAIVALSKAEGLILSAEGTVFSAGHDFRELWGATESDLHKNFSTTAELAMSFRRLGIPVVASVQGAAIGAGVQMALSCDFVIAQREAFFQTPGGARGWFCYTPMVALGFRLAPCRALEMLMAGEPVSAPQALDWGMINRVVSAAELAAVTRSFMESVTRGSVANRAQGKRSFYEIFAAEEAKAYSEAVRVMARTGAEQDAQARIHSFIERSAVSNERRAAPACARLIPPEGTRAAEKASCVEREEQKISPTPERGS